MENKEDFSDEEIQEWLSNGKKQIIYTFEDWLEEKPVPDEFWIFDKKKSIEKGYKVFSDHLLKILNSLDWAWNYALQMEINFQKETIEFQLSIIEDLRDKKLFLKEQRKKLKKYFKNKEARKQKLNVYLKSSPVDLFYLIDGKKFLRIKECSENSIIELDIIENINFDAQKNHELLKFIDFHFNNLHEPEQFEKLENLSHKLCLLHELGVMDLLEERFKYKNYHGTAPATDKARLIASLFDIENPEKVRLALKPKNGKIGYLNKKYIEKTIQTLKNLGLEPSKLTD